MGTPATEQLRIFLGMVGFYRIWISQFDLIAKPLYEDLREPEEEPLDWIPEMT